MTTTPSTWQRHASTALAAVAIAIIVAVALALAFRLIAWILP